MKAVERRERQLAAFGTNRESQEYKMALAEYEVAEAELRVARQPLNSEQRANAEALLKCAFNRLMELRVKEHDE